MSFYRSALLFLPFLLIQSSVFSQEEPEFKKNAFAIDITQMASNEINLNHEHFFSSRKSLELSAGLIYVNDALESLSEGLSNSHYFSEHGFSFRAAFKLYKRPVPDSKWRDYIAPAIMYKYLYFNNQWFENEKDSAGIKFTESLFQHRYRSKFGFEFLWGKVYNFNQTFALELFYGVGLRATTSVRTDIYRKNEFDTTAVTTLDFEDERFFIRPALRAGAKFRISF